MKRIITISREFGSGGHSIGQKVAEKLNLRFHDQALLEKFAQEFDLDEVGQRILNADGASWIKKVKDKSTCFQLDPFHRNKAVKEKIHEETAREAILELLREEEIEELFRYLEIDRSSLSDEDEMEDAEERIRYYENNREGLVPYPSQELESSRRESSDKDTGKKRENACGTWLDIRNRKRTV